MKKILLLLLVGLVSTSFGPPNCNLFKDNEACFEACQEAEKAIMHPQGSRASQLHFDKSISLCPTFDYSYYEKGVPYAKRGLNRQWKKLLDKAVALNPKEYLGIRGWYHYLFMKNYKEAVVDLEAYEKMMDDVGYSGNGRYHLSIIKALSYKGLGEKEKALHIIEKHLASTEFDPGLYDYFHLGVLYLELNRLEESEQAFQKQIAINEFAEIHYYRGLSSIKKGDLPEASEHFKFALQQYKSGKILNVPYTIMMDKIYQKNIETELSKLSI